MSRVLLLSVRPRFAQSLLTGTKTAEVRRRFPAVPAGTTVVIYSSSPQKAVLGTMKVHTLVRSTATNIWRDYSNAIAIDQTELLEYLKGASDCSVLELDSPSIWANPVGLNVMRRAIGVEPAQSFRYLTARQLLKLETLAGARRDDAMDLPSIRATESLRALA